MLNLHIIKKLKKKNSKSYLDMIIDSVIIAGITFFSTWSGSVSLDQLFIVLKASGLSFFIQLAYEKGIRQIKK